MDYPDNNTESRENKHLNFQERLTIQIRLKDGFSAYKIAKELDPLNKCDYKWTTPWYSTQIKQGNNIETYIADTGEAVYKKHRLHSCRTFKRLACSEFIN